MKRNIISEDNFNVLVPSFSSDNKTHNVDFNTGNTLSSYFLLDV